MENEKIIAVCEKYEKNLKGSYLLDKDLQHIKWMLMKIPKFIEKNQQEKANRWLGFVQGALWVKKIYTVNEMREDNRAEK